MKKRLTSVIAIILCTAMAFGLSSCNNADGGEEDESEFVAATLPISENVPVSEKEIIEFYNDVITNIQDNSLFTAENKPGVKTNESLNVNDINILAYNPLTQEATEDNSLKALNKSAKAIKDRILSGIDTSIPVIPFGDMNSSVSTVIYPYNSTEMHLSAADVQKAECNVDANNLNITLTISPFPETVEKVFGIRNKTELLNNLHEHCGEYAEINDYEVAYTNDEENDIQSTINLSVEVEKQDDGTYKCTGRITSLDIKIISDVTAFVTAKGSFEENGDLRITFRLTDEKYYEFDWLGSSTWEPKGELMSE